MAKNTQVETTQKSQATNKNTDKVKTLKNAQERKKAREEQFRNFRINALRRRCTRMGLSDEKIEELVKKLIEQMNAPKEYDILVTFNQKYPRKKLEEGEIFKKDIDIFCDSLKENKLEYRYRGDTFVSIGGNQEVLAKIREIAPQDAKIFPYAKKMESVIPKQEPSQKKPTNNTAAKKKAANPKRPVGKAVKSTRHFHRMQKGRYKNLRTVSLAYKRIKRHKATTVQMAGKTPSEGSKTLKKAA